jgi:hypothetical protein
MKRPTPVEFAAFIIAAVLVFTGLHAVLRPTPVLVTHATNSHRGDPTGSVGGVVSPNGARFYGFATIVVGLGFGLVALGRRGQ